MSDALRTKLLIRLEEAGLTPTALAVLIKRDKNYFRDFLNGRKGGLSVAAMEEADRELDKAIARRKDPNANTPPEDWIKPPLDFFGSRDLPVFASVEGGPGEMVVSTDPIELVPRPWFLKQVKEGYAVLVIGESMIPAYEPGDMAIVNPRVPAIKGKHAIFVGGEQHGEFRATIKRFVGATPEHWKAEQYNPPPGEKKELLLPKKLWTRALRVVGKYEGG